MNNICLICNRTCKTLLALSKHITKTENISLGDYYDRFLDSGDKTCKVCNKEKRSFLNLRLGYSDTCNNHTCIQTSNKNKREDTIFKKYGCKNVSQTEYVRNKRLITFQKKFGSNTPLQNKEIAKKLSLTLTNKDKDYWRCRTQKTIKTVRQKYNVNNINQLDIVKQKKIQTSKKHYNTDYPAQSKIIKDKTIQTNLKNRGVNWSFQDPVVREKSKQVLMNKFGYDNYSKTTQFRQLAREQMIQLIMNNYKDGTVFSPMKGFQEKECFDEIQKHCIYPLLEDQKFIGYFPDRYIKELNLVVEFYEKWHNYSWSSKHDPIREKDLIDYLQCGFFIIREEEWKENKQKVIQEFTSVVTKTRNLT